MSKTTIHGKVKSFKELDSKNGKDKEILLILTCDAGNYEPLNDIPIIITSTASKYAANTLKEHDFVSVEGYLHPEGKSLKRHGQAGLIFIGSYIRNSTKILKC